MRHHRPARAVALAAALLAFTLSAGAMSAPASAAALTVGSRAGTLEQVLAEHMAGIPRRGSEAYRVVPPVTFGALRKAAAALARDDVRGAARALGGTDAVLERLREPDGSRYVVLRKSHAGLLVLRAGTGGTVVQAPHPLADLRSEDAALEAFRAAGLRAFAVSSAHRAANADGSADAAHRADHGFHALHLGLLDGGLRAAQVHGFASASHPGLGDAVVSAGGPPSLWAERADLALGAAGYASCLYGRECGELGGVSNVQGQASRAAGRDFLHVEVVGGIRQEDEPRRAFTRALAPALR